MTTMVSFDGLARRAAWLGIALLTALVLAAVTPAQAAGAINASTWTGTAIEGYDPVAYFTEGRPIEGEREFQHEWMGATWYFANADNRDRFASDPENYAPQYGGYCAYAVAQGGTAAIDPDAWHIEGGKLYLNLNKQVQGLWLQDVPGYIAKADGNWPEIRARLAN